MFSNVAEVLAGGGAAPARARMRAAGVVSRSMPQPAFAIDSIAAGADITWAASLFA
jgi:hypothetical protein